MSPHPLDGTASTALSPASPASPSEPRTAAWIRLQEGNQRFVTGHSTAGDARGPQRRAELVAGQKPFAAVLSCADSRVPTEILFDQGLGDLFVVRTAGHAVDSSVLGSLEYAVVVLGVDLIVVLGHASCGAVAAAAQTVAGAPVPGGHVRDIVERLTCNITAAQFAGFSDLHDLARWHSAASAQLLTQRSAVIGEALFHGQVGLVSATYDLGSGLITATPTFAPAADHAHNAGRADNADHSDHSETATSTTPGTTPQPTVAPVAPVIVTV